MTNTTSKRPTSTSSCPYAAQFRSIDTTRDTTPDKDTQNGNETKSDDIAHEVEESIAKCPAFALNATANNRIGSDPGKQLSCPFRNATSSRDVQRVIMQIPQSHVSSTSPTAMQFKKALHAMHVVQQSNESKSEEGLAEQYKMVVADCPFKAFSNAKKEESFLDVLEHLSFSSALTSMAEAVAKEDHQDRDGLSAELKEGTARSHRAAENVHFVRNFIKGRIDRDLYIQLIANLYFVYECLEDEIEKYAMDTFPTLHEPEKLNRKASLQLDLEFFLGSDWKRKVTEELGLPSRATIDYVHRIRKVAESDPILLLSHSYTRYLGDLSGGKVLQRVAKKALNLKKSSDGGIDGLRFYEFPLIVEGAKAFKNHYRESLDQMSLSAWKSNRLVSEANVAFVLNMRIFEELDCFAGVKGAAVRPLEDALAYLVDLEDTETKQGEEKCPFGFVGTNPHKPVHVTKESIDGKPGNADRCPWPFIFLHDPMTGT